MQILKNSFLRGFSGLAVILALLAGVALATEATPTEPAVPAIVPAKLLVSDLVPMVLPAFHDAEQAGVSWDDLLKEMPARPGQGWPRAGDSFAAANGTSAQWSVVDAPGGVVALAAPAGAGVRYLAFTLSTDRWQKLTLTVADDHPLFGTIDDSDLGLARKDGADGAPATHTAELKLTVGKHLVVLRTLHHDANLGAWSVGVSATPDSAGAVVALDTTPERAVDIQTVLNAPRIGSVSVTPDGKLAAISLSEYRNGSDRESWLEVRDTAKGRLVRLWRGDHAPSGVQWHPQGHRLTWQVTTGESSSVHTYDLESGTTEIVLADVEHLGDWRWTPDGRSIIYAVNHQPEPDARKIKRVLNPADRQPWWRGRSHLMQVFVPSGVVRRLTAGPVSASSWEISPDSGQLVFFTSEPDLTQRPFDTSELWRMDLTTLQVERILTDPWIGGAAWSPDGRQLLLQGSPSAFDGLGRNLPAGMAANDYGGQLYLYDLATGQPTAISRNLRPDVGWTTWSPADGLIYANTTDTQYDNVYRSRPGSDKWEKVAGDLDVTAQVALARDARVAVTRGSGATSPNTVHVIDLKRNQDRLLLDPGTAWYRDVVFGKVENWVAQLDKGMALDGFVYFPPGFDPASTYPLIVYYYGGTSPINRDFGGRYPKNVWAGQGYVVYVPNPSGATGYGQEFAARHVNDWGRLTAPEVIEGTRKFLAAHPFADPAKVGCMGASYGGFLTEYIITQTDLFAAAVSHAGISDISSYWGEGLWGYAYGARALAGSFPWADRDLFVEQSALFHADKITTPLLLVHGDSDTNVPKGESDQLFTALKLLGKDVEYVQIVGQDHHILDHDQRIVWNDTILAYLAKYLQDSPAWWNEMFPVAKDFR
jgi:dipeptidyl aminopeptidase/acylaminoacyl peptidase